MPVIFNLFIKQEAIRLTLQPKKNMCRCICRLKIKEVPTMQNFDYMTPTRLIFGKDVIEKLPEVMSQFGKKILLTYGGGSIKKIGLYDKVKELLSGFEIIELSGIQPNPKYDPSVLDGVKLCKENNVDVILKGFASNFIFLY